MTNANEASRQANEAWFRVCDLREQLSRAEAAGETHLAAALAKAVRLQLASWRRADRRVQRLETAP